jgi:hypothetical protein
LIITNNATIDLIAGAMTISYSPVSIKSSTITSSDKTAQGFLIINANDSPYQSYLKEVNFNNIQNPTDNRWSLPSAVTFYQSDVEIKNCNFSDNISGDDFLNIFRANFKIDNCSFSNILSDAIDIDFSKGSIENCVLTNCGNDAIDASGSTINIENLQAKNISDKVISAGEGSKLSCSNIEITDAELAFTSKDNSTLTIKKSKAISCKVLFTAFQKKITYGGAKIIAANITKQNITEAYLFEKKSSLIIDGNIIKPNHDNVRDILYGVKYGKSSKKAIVEQ